MPSLVTPQQRSQSARASNSLRVVPKVRVSCWRRPGVVSLGTRMATSTSALAMSRPATRSANSGSSSASSIDVSYDDRAVTAAAVVRRSQGQKGNLVRGLEAPLSGPEGWLPRSDSGPKIRPWLGARQRPAARQRRRTQVCASAGCGQGLAGVGGDGLDGDLVAQPFEAFDVVAGLAAGVHALFVVVGAEVLVAVARVRQQRVDAGEHGVAGRDQGFFLGHALG